MSKREILWEWRIWWDGQEMLGEVMTIQTSSCPRSLSFCSFSFSKKIPQKMLMARDAMEHNEDFLLFCLVKPHHVYSCWNVNCFLPPRFRVYRKGGQVCADRTDYHLWGLDLAGCHRDHLQRRHNLRFWNQRASLAVAFPAKIRKSLKWNDLYRQSVGCQVLKCIKAACEAK